MTLSALVGSNCFVRSTDLHFVNEIDEDDSHSVSVAAAEEQDGGTEDDSDRFQFSIDLLALISSAFDIIKK